MVDENVQRGNWDSHSEYLLSMIGYAVGLVLAYENGGGGFLIPYFVMLVLAGLPIFFLSTAIGQFCSLGPGKVYSMAPVFRGLGIAMVFYSVVVGIYYNMIIAYSSFYMFASFTTELPWSKCDNYWNNLNASNGPICTNTRQLSYCKDFELSNFLRNQNTSGLFAYNETFATDLLPQIYTQNCTDFASDFTCADNSVIGNTNDMIIDKVPLLDIRDFIIEMATNYRHSSMNASMADKLAIEAIENACPVEQQVKYVNAPSEFFTKYALNITSSIEESGQVQLHLVYALMFAWFICYFTIIKGVKSSGKVVWFTALFPYVVLLCLVIRGLTLEGASEGVQYYIGNKSDLSKLKDPSVWRKATTQIFFSLSVGMGGLGTLSSYNKFNNNCCRDSIIVSMTNCATSIFGGFAIFPSIGHLAHVVGRPVPDVVDASFGLAFQVYPEAISKMPGSPVWSILFFIMLITLGLDSQFAILETVMTAFTDIWPQSMKYRIHILSGFAVTMFFLGLNLCTQSGLYWLDIMDNAAAGWALMLTGLIETIAVAWFYGVQNLIRDIESMIGPRSKAWWAYWVVCWSFVTPVLLIAILVWQFAEYKPIEGPDWAVAINWLITGTGLIIIIAWMIYAVIRDGKGAFKPSNIWGPALQKHREEWIAMKQK